MFWLVAAVMACTAASAPALVPWSPLTFADVSARVPDAFPIMPFDPQNRSLTWAIDASCCGYGPFTAENVTRASEFYGLFSAPCGRDATGFFGEWGYEFHHFDTSTPPCGDLVSAAYPSPPASRNAALERLQAYFLCRVAAAEGNGKRVRDTQQPTYQMLGHYFYFHYGLAWASPALVATETGENINSINAHFAFLRGAARQFSVPWQVDFSAWFAGKILDYSSPGFMGKRSQNTTQDSSCRVLGFWGQASEPTGSGGHSLSLFKRTYFSVYMSGAGGLIAEAGAVNYFLESTTSAGIFNLSPLGDIGQQLYNLTTLQPQFSSRAIPLGF